MTAKQSSFVWYELSSANVAAAKASHDKKARDELPYLLDPAASPPARVSTSDGVIAAMLFFVVKGITLAIFMASTHQLSGVLAYQVWM